MSVQFHTRRVTHGKIRYATSLITTSALSLFMGQRVSAQNFMTLDHPGPANTALNGINNSGKIVGQAGSPGKWKGFVYAGITFTDVIVSCDKCESTIAYGINHWGDVVGSHFTGDRDWGFVAIGGRVTISPTDASIQLPQASMRKIKLSARTQMVIW